MKVCVILGGGGYIGGKWMDRLVSAGRFDRIIIADLREPSVLPPRAEFFSCDVRKPIFSQLPEVCPDWIFNFAAIHREPGHERREYFDTNVAGAKHACAFAEETNCRNILFTSSIAVYGPTAGPTSEETATYPTTPYGISKLCAEYIHEGWQKAGSERRLTVCRPGVIYGPGDPGNILRMIRAIRRGYFVFPGSPKLRKSYGYIEGLLDSFEWAMARDDEKLTYNYVERETEPLGRLVELVQAQINRRVPTISAPCGILAAAASVVQVLSGGRSPIHPMRVRKAATSTHIIPKVLSESGFSFRFDFAESLRHWAQAAPEDFA